MSIAIIWSFLRSRINKDYIYIRQFAVLEGRNKEPFLLLM